MIQVGKKHTENGTTYYELEYDGQGSIYKDEDAFLNRPDEVCYIPEAAASDSEDWMVAADDACCYTRNDLLELCDGDEKLCEFMFYELDWSCPETWLEGFEGEV